MCMLCVEINKQNMTPKEVARAYREFTVPDGHFGELLVEIQKYHDLEVVGKELSALYEEEQNDK